MPPTIHNNVRQDRGRNPGDKRSELVYRVKYNNTLPDIPFDAKSITYPFDTTRYVQYNPTSLERNYKYDLLTEHDLGITVDLIATDSHLVNPNIKISPKDELLLEDEVIQNVDSKRSLNHRKNVSWLRKTEYISTEYNRFVQTAQKAEARVGYNINKKITDEILYKDRDSQIKAINSTFEAAAKPLAKHYSRPNVTPMEILPIFPDFEMWKHPCAQVIFDTDPAPAGKSQADQMEEISQAIICGEQFVTYYLPTRETVGKRKRDQESGIDYEKDEEYDYMLAREYNWTVKNRSPSDCVENYFLVFRENGVFYNELETRVRLSKRRKIGQSGSSSTKSRLVVRHRPFTSQEVTAQDARSSILEPLGEEEDEMETTQHADTEKNDEEEEEAHSEPENEREKVEEKDEKSSDDESSDGAESDNNGDPDNIFGNSDSD